MAAMLYNFSSVTLQAIRMVSSGSAEKNLYISKKEVWNVQRGRKLEEEVLEKDNNFMAISLASNAFL